ncbi:MAG: cyclic lactone autoinducer peptide [Oscillospiraceae bacterium]|jgi:cyclic lactone autoinducer peptide|nr:cyclic lactone autoinducer peptide [Oscillospiraceae bacterium]
MKKVLQVMAALLAFVSIFSATLSANAAACFFILHEPKAPQALDSLKKFK